MDDEDKVITGVGCVVILLWFGWIAFVIWAVISLINWITSK